jgi:chromosome segregation ATPase
VEAEKELNALVVNSKNLISSNQAVEASTDESNKDIEDLKRILSSLKERSVSVSNDKQSLAMKFTLTNEQLTEEQQRSQQAHKDYSEISEKLATVQEEKRELLNELTSVHQKSTSSSNETDVEEDVDLIGGEDVHESSSSFSFLFICLLFVILTVVAIVWYNAPNLDPFLFDFSSMNSFFDSIVFDDEVLL